MKNVTISTLIANFCDKKLHQKEFSWIKKIFQRRKRKLKSVISQNLFICNINYF